MEGFDPYRHHIPNIRDVPCQGLFCKTRAEYPYDGYPPPGWFYGYRTPEDGDRDENHFEELGWYCSADCLARHLLRYY